MVTLTAIEMDGSNGTAKATFSGTTPNEYGFYFGPEGEMERFVVEEESNGQFSKTFIVDAPTELYVKAFVQVGSNDDELSAETGFFSYGDSRYGFTN